MRVQAEFILGSETVLVDPAPFFDALLQRKRFFAGNPDQESLRGVYSPSSYKDLTALLLEYKEGIFCFSSDDKVIHLKDTLALEEIGTVVFFLEFDSNLGKIPQLLLDLRRRFRSANKPFPSLYCASGGDASSLLFRQMLLREVSVSRNIAQNINTSLWQNSGVLPETPITLGGVKPPAAPLCRTAQGSFEMDVPDTDQGVSETSLLPGAQAEIAQEASASISESESESESLFEEDKLPRRRYERRLDKYNKLKKKYRKLKAKHAELEEESKHSKEGNKELMRLFQVQAIERGRLLREATDFAWEQGRRGELLGRMKAP